jgi:hypothetical protein
MLKCAIYSPGAGGRDSCRRRTGWPTATAGMCVAGQCNRWQGTYLTSAMRNMNFSCPSRRAIAAHSEMNTERPLCLGCESLAKTMPRLTASRIMPETFWRVRNMAEDQHTPTDLLPKPMVACNSSALQVLPDACTIDSSAQHCRTSAPYVHVSQLRLPPLLGESAKIRKCAKLIFILADLRN